MKHWIGFWTAVWVGSAWIYRHFLTWLTGRPTDPVEQPEQAPATEETTDEDQEQPPANASAAQRRSTGGVLVRLLALVLAAGFIRGLPHTTDILLALAAAWAATSIIAGFAIAMAERDDTEQGQEPEQPNAADPADTLTRDDVAPFLHGLLQDTGGVQLKTLAKALPARPKQARWATRDVRALLARVGIRVRAGVRAPGESSREGVHRDDVPPLPQPPSETTPVAVVAAGQSNNNNATYVITDDPDNPVRHTVLHTERT
ncbi:hypothetical protein ACFT7S_28275 [Streptomyces sp. NPDC057136]|uniref:hypothetical protein n=1 Tax=Streptomyces sp. NPDC057136 TaxID=3346029 RepID=UPI00363512A5